ncbi:MAG: yliA [Chitinophagaceae bacterium]|nr:yliA [Chitinophagaceae bacterium]
MSRKQLTEENFLLDVRDLKTYFPSEQGIVKAVDDVSFTLRRGETVGIVGESGSGKSVTALSIMGLINRKHSLPMQGNIFFNSPSKGIIDLTHLTPKEFQNERGNEISMIFQEPMTSLNPVFTCGDQIRETILAHRKVSRQQAHELTLELFEKVQLPRPKDIYNSYPHQISGGQKQRVMIAMAMCCNPSLMIADEPTTALDVTVQARILDLMRNLRDENNMSMLFITHDLGVVAEIADYIIVMYRGKIVEQGPIFDIFSNPQHPYTKGLLACRPRLDIKLKVLPVVSDFMTVNENGIITERDKNISVVDALIDNIQIDEELREKNRLKRVDTQPQLVIKNLKTYFTNKRNFLGKPLDFTKAVDDVSFEVYPGETIGLVGESGCGKTTLGRSILRLVEPTAGQIIFEGEDITHIKHERLRELRKDMQIIFQDPYSSLNPRMTIGEAIIEPMRVNDVLESDYQRVKKAIELLERVNLHGNHFNRYPHEFSGGQRQRICIARALALSPKFIVCDESVSALDVSVQAQVLNLLNELKEEFKFTNIFISHDLSVVKFISDRIIVMNKGKIVEEGDGEDVYNHPQSDYTQTLISSIPQIDFDALRKKRTSSNKGELFQ